MVTISKARNAVRLQTYHEKELASSAENYYSHNAEIEGEWRGLLAESWGLNGPVTAEAFGRLAEGQHPFTGEQLVRHRLASPNSAAHRAGWDATFSAPKTVSLTALIGGSQAATPEEKALAERVADAHRHAARVGADYLERFVDARMGGDNPTRRTGRWVAALFDHDSSRPVNGYAAPQLHTHVVFFNMTQTEDGKVRSVDPKSLFGAQQVAKAVYQAELRHALERLGFTIQVGKNDAPEIAGYTDDYRRANSTRAEVIAARAEEIRREHGVSMAEAKQRAALETREAKLPLTQDQVRTMHLACSAQYGHQEPAVLSAALARQKHLGPDPKASDRIKTAHQCLTYARDHLFEREAVNLEIDLIRHALIRGQGRILAPHVEQALAERCDKGEFIPMTKGPENHRAYTTAEVVKTEAENIRLMTEGKGTFLPLVPTSELQQSFLTRLDSEGTGNQRQAAVRILTSTDKFQGLQGAAGTGKTYTLRTIREAVQANGWTVRGFAPTARASRELANSGMEVVTLQRFLIEQENLDKHSADRVVDQDLVEDAAVPGLGLEPPPPPQPPAEAHKPTLYVLDETSLADVYQVNRLLKALHAEDRLLLVGDTRQHEAVGAGRAFAQLQEHGLDTAHLTKIVRQKDAPDLKRVVELFYAGQIDKGVQRLQELGCIQQVAAPESRYEAIADSYMKDPDHTLVISPDNKSRAAINAVIRTRLQEAGRLSSEEYGLSVLENRTDMTGAQRTWAKQYEVGNVLLYGRTSKVYGIKADQYAKVMAVDDERNTITVRKDDGDVVTYDPSRFKGILGAYRFASRNLAVGDLIQFTANSKSLALCNRDRAVIREFTPDRKVRAQLYQGPDQPLGRIITFDPADFRHVDHGYAFTSHSAQGLTETNTILNVDTANMNPLLINERLAYVAGSRMRLNLTIYCNDAGSLAEALSRDVSKSSAIGPPPNQEHTMESQFEQAAIPLLQGDIQRAAQHLKDAGALVELPNDKSYSAIAEEYCKSPSDTAIIATDPQARAEINAAVHRALQANSAFTFPERTIPVLIERSLDQATRERVSSYRVGDIIRFQNGEQRNEEVRVLAIEDRKNTLIVEGTNGAQFAFNPERHPNLSVFRAQQVPFCAGERIEFGQSDPQTGITANTRGTLLEVDQKGRLAVHLDSTRQRGRPHQVVIDPPTFGHHISHTYAEVQPRRLEKDARAVTLVHVDAVNMSPEHLVSQFIDPAPNHKLKIYCSDAHGLARSVSEEVQRRPELQQQVATLVAHRTANDRGDLAQMEITDSNQASARAPARGKDHQLDDIQQHQGGLSL